MKDVLIIRTMVIILCVQILGHKVVHVKYIQSEEERGRRGGEEG